ncbi:MAG: hypothetical protein HXS53_12030 [Theionarchaea archaeon]|nr:hypothetical protein [Theionarchaea archaeon]
MNSEKIQGLLKQKSDWKKLRFGLEIGYGVTCAAFLALACGPALFLCAVAAVAICGQLVTSIHLSIDLSLEDIEKQMYEAGCACAIWCG